MATRSQAEFGLGQVLQKMAEHWTNRTELLEGALEHYLNVVYSRRLQKGEDPDPFWLNKAAVSAGTLAVEQLQHFDQAERLYQSMLKTLPSQSAIWEKKLEILRQQRPK